MSVNTTLSITQAQHLLLLCILQHLSLLAQIPQHGLPTGNVLVQRRVRAVEEILLPQRMLLARDIAAAHRIATTSRAIGTSTPCKRARARARGAGVRIWVLGRRGDVGPAAEQLGTVLAVEDLVALRLERVELFAVLGELGAEVSDALVGFVLLRGVELLLGERVVLVDGPLEGG